MRIAHIQPSVIRIPPNGWGAIEKIIWDYKQELEFLGHEVSIVNLSELDPSNFDIVHCHMFDQALHLAEKGIPYFYSHHDHHSMVWGTESANFRLNLEAMQKAEVAFVHAKSSIDTFERVPFYLPHGVNRNYFQYRIRENKYRPRIIIVGNNGLAGTDKVFDRKGFRYAIEAAEKLGLEITLVAPRETQERFFEENPELRYSNLNYVYDATEEELKNAYNVADIMVHATYVEAGHPPLTPLEALSCGIPVIGTPMGEDVPLIECERDTQSVIEAINFLIPQIKTYSIKADEVAEKYNWKNIVENNLLPWYLKSLDRDSMANVGRRIYHQAVRQDDSDKFMVKYIDGAQVDVVGKSNRKYKCEVYDHNTGEVVFTTELGCGMFAKSAKRYHREWVWKITDEEGREYLHPYDAKGKRVYIAFESSSLGDTLAWIPYVEEFRKLHECEVTCSTHWNHLFKDVYPDIEFIPAGQVVYNIYAMYRVGWFYENDGQIPHFGHHSRDFRKYSLQATICDILGLPDTEIKPKIKNIPAKENDGKKVVVIAPHATAWAKYWHNPEGWAKVVEFLQLQGYEVWNISKEPMTDEWHNSKLPSDALKNVIDLSGNYPIEERISQIKCASLFIGLGSGLSWLAWACETPVVLISGFSRPESEFQDCVRIFNQNVCNGCFNDYRLDAGNWQWCPKYEKTAQQFECSKSITPEMVIDGIRTLL